jgi:hypothetical protein
MLLHLTKSKKDILLGLICSFIGLFIFCLLNRTIYFPIGANIFDASGDGLKNFYTFSYYLKYGFNFTFNGLLYPFGDLVTYMDAQPLYVWFIWVIEKLFHYHIENPIIYIHLIILINILLAYFFIFLILRYFKVSIFISFIGTLVIVLLAPQMYRTGDHFALGSIAIIPFFWWWRLRISKLSTYHYVFLSLALSLVGFIHPYLLLMVVMLLFFYEIVQCWFSKKLQFQFLFPLSSMILFYVFIKLIDSIKDRPENAWGAKNFSCKLYDLFLPINGGLKNLLTNKYNFITPGYTEGHAYITIFGISVIFITGFWIIKYFRKKQLFYTLKNNIILHWLLASLPILFIAFYIPFRWNEELFAPINPFKQFRGTGRFIFVFYFVYLVYTVVIIDKFFQKKNKKVNFIFFILFIITINDIVNAYQYMYSRFEAYGKSNAYNYYKEYVNNLFSAVNNKADYESIIVYPPSTEGTEKVWIDNDWDAKISSFWISYFTGIPLANVKSSRVSFEDCMQIYQLSSYYTVSKDILKKFNPKKKQLVLLQTERLNDDIPLIQYAKLLTTYGDIALLEINLDTLRNINITKTNWIDSSYTLIIKNTFDKGKDTCLLIQKTTNLIELKLNAHQNFTKLRVVFWYTPNKFKNTTVPICSLFSIKENGERVLLKDWRESQTNTYNYKDDWLCVDYSLPLTKEQKNLLFSINGYNFYLDNFEVYGK